MPTIAQHPIDGSGVFLAFSSRFWVSVLSALELLSALPVGPINGYPIYLGTWLRSKRCFSVLCLVLDEATPQTQSFRFFQMLQAQSAYCLRESPDGIRWQCEPDGIRYTFGGRSQRIIIKPGIALRSLRRRMAQQFSHDEQRLSG